MFKKKSIKLSLTLSTGSLFRSAAGVAHEINNPLAGVLIYADMLMKEIKHNEHWAGLRRNHQPDSALQADCLALIGVQPAIFGGTSRF